MTTTKEHQISYTHLYRSAPFWMLRAPALPAHIFHQISTCQPVPLPVHDQLFSESIKATEQLIFEMSADPMVE